MITLNIDKRGVKQRARNMKDYQFEDLNQVIDYNSELWMLFLGTSEDAIRKSGLPEATTTELSQSLDLVRAINSYRSYRTPERLFDAYPELSAQRDYVDLLWKHFDSLSNEELSDLVMEMIHEVCNCSEKQS